MSEKFKEDLNSFVKMVKPLFLGVTLITTFIDLVAVDVPYHFLTFLSLFLWIVVYLMYPFSPNIFLLLALCCLIVISVILSFGSRVTSEKFANWAFYYLVLTFITSTLKLWGERQKKQVPRRKK